MIAGRRMNDSKLSIFNSPLSIVVVGGMGMGM